MEDNLTTGKVFPRLMRFALPILGANLLQAMYSTVDLIVVGQFASTSAVSAVSTGSVSLQTIIGMIAGLTMGCTVLLGQNIGMKNNRGAARTVASSVILFTVLGILLTAGIAAGAGLIAQVMKAPAEALRETTGYIRICGFGIICIVFFNAISGVFRGIGDSRSPFILMLIACVCNIAGDLLLVGVFDMGSDGAAIATVAAQGISVLSALAIVKKRGLGFACDRADLKPGRSEMLTVLRYGLPIAAQEALTGVSFMVILAILNGFGLIASAGVGVAEKICNLIFIVPGAFMAAESAFAAQNVGAGAFDRAKKSMLLSMAATVGVGIVMFLITFTNGQWLAGFFSKDAEVCAAAADYLRSYSIDCVIVGINFSMMGYLNGNGRTGFVSLQGILSTFLVRIPVSWFMSKIPGVSLFQVGFATPLATAFAILLTGAYVIVFERKRTRLSAGK